MEPIATSTSSSRSTPCSIWSRAQLEDAIEGHVLGGAELIGTYERLP
jgi:phosphatidylethanolamine-binding protein (PEBP) family uncharacterized protein